MGYFHGNDLVAEMAHAVDGKQYVAISAGHMMCRFALPDAGPGNGNPFAHAQECAWARGYGSRVGRGSKSFQIETDTVPTLEACRKAQCVTPWRADCVAREKSSKVDHIQYIGEIFAIGLKSHGYAIGAIDLGARRDRHLE
jgi:hypothetical protein